MEDGPRLLHGKQCVIEALHDFVSTGQQEIPMLLNQLYVTRTQIDEFRDVIDNFHDLFI
jgi:hypothetical protein